MSIHCGDAVDFLQRLPDSCIDLMVTDPPYESLEIHRMIGTTARLKRAWFPTVPNAYLVGFFIQVFRVLKPDSHFYLFCHETTADEIKWQQGIVGEPDCRNSNGSRRCFSGFTFWKELLWVKTTNDGKSVRSWSGYHWRNSSERIMFFEKGKRKLNNLGEPDSLLAPRSDGAYPTQKPEEVLKRLIANSSSEGQVVCDPFAGSFSTCWAAEAANRLWIGNDIGAEACEQARAKASLMSPRSSFVPPERVLPMRQATLL